MAIKRKLRFDVGGKTPLPYSQLGSALGDLFDSVTPTDMYGIKSDFNAGLGSSLKEAGQYASLGSALGPVGTGVGAAFGLVKGAVDGTSLNDKMKKMKEQALLMRDQSDFNRSAGVLASYKQGNDQNQIYSKYGGSIRSLAKGGNLVPLSSDSVEVQGPSHEEGGVDIGNNVEVEGDETINKNFVFSDELGFAKLHKPIARAIGKIEKKPISPTSTKTLEILKNKEEALKQEQETLKQSLGITPITKMAFGGELGGGEGDGEGNKKAKDDAAYRERINQAYSTYLQNNQFEGKPRKPVVDIDSTDPIFKDRQAYDAYYLSKARKTLSPEDTSTFNMHFNAGNTNAWQDMLNLKGGIIDFDTYKTFLPQDSNIQPINKSNPSNPSYRMNLPVRRETARVGFNKGKGRLGFRTIS